MSSTLPETPPEQAAGPSWLSPRERAPSEMRADEPRLARWLGAAGAGLVTLGGAALLFSATGRGGLFFGPTWGTIFLLLGIAGLLYHAIREPDLQFRRLYGVLGYACLALGVLVTALPLRGGPAGAMFLPYGVPALTLGLLFLLAFARNETEPAWWQAVVYVLGGAGLVMALVAFIGGSISEAFLFPYTPVLALLGLFYLWAAVTLPGGESDLGHRTAQGIGVIGAVALLVALGRSAIPPLLYSLHAISTRPAAYFMPSGLVLSVLALVYLGLAVSLSSDIRLVVMTKRELASLFYSPIAYFVLFGMLVLSWWMYREFLFQLWPSVRQLMSGRPSVHEEPIIRMYFISWWMVITLIFLVPVLTMRLLSEEKRSGTMEVLLTAPVSEVLVVLSKFLATFIFFLIAFVPMGAYLVALRVEGGQPFEYRPLLSFLVGMACAGAGFLAMGLFFSSLTRNQIASALLTAVGMLGLTAIFFVEQGIERENASSVWVSVLTQMSYIHLWLTSSEGMLMAPMLLFHVSAAVFWLFLTVKVLEARKWL